MTAEGGVGAEDDFEGGAGCRGGGVEGGEEGGEVVVADGWFGEGCFCVFVEDTGVFCCRRGWWHFWGVL